MKSLVLGLLLLGLLQITLSLVGVSSARAQEVDPIAHCRLRLPGAEVELGSTMHFRLRLDPKPVSVQIENKKAGFCEGVLRTGSRVENAANTAILGGRDCRATGLSVSLEPHADPRRFTLWAFRDNPAAKDRYLCTWLAGKNFD